MSNLLVVTTVTEVFGAALTQVRTDAMEFIAQGLPTGLAIMGTILAITIGVKAFKRFAK